MTAWKLTVEGVYHIRGHGLVAAGKMTADVAPSQGQVLVRRPDGSTETRIARAFERFAIPNWWMQNVGVLLDGDDDVPIGSTICLEGGV